MKKRCFARVAALLLCAALLLPALLSCGGSFLVSDSTAAKAITVTITTICEEGTTEEAIGLVQNAINDVTEAQFNTHVVLRMLPEEQFEEFVLTASEQNYLKGIGAIEEEEPDEEDGETTDEEAEDLEIQTGEDGEQFYVTSNGDKHVLDENGRGHVVYPEAGEQQLDIVLIPNLTVYDELVNGYTEEMEAENGDTVTVQTPYLAELGTEEIPFGSLLGKYVPNYNVSVRYALGLTKHTYAIPNNTYHGDYRYLLVNKDLFDKYQYDINVVSGMADLLPFLQDIAAAGEPVQPIAHYAGYHWMSFLGEDSVVSMAVANSYITDIVNYPAPIFDSSVYRSELSVLRDLRNMGYSWSEDEYYDPEQLEPFGVTALRGDPTIPEKYEDEYYVVTAEKPQITSEMYDGMYGISSSCAYPARAMEVLTLFSTNAEMANLLAYGVEGPHYDLSPDGIVTNRSADYRINPRYAGNNFLLRQNDEMSETELKYSANNWELAKTQNRDLVLNFFCGFQVYGDEIIQQQLADMDALSRSITARVDEYDEASGMSYDEYLRSLGDEIRSSPEYTVVSKVVAGSSSPSDNSPFQQFNRFFLARYMREE